MPLARSVNGHFAMGNDGGPGNPHAKRTAHIKRVLLDSVTDDDLRTIVKSLIEQAKGGNAKAAEVILNRLLGKPTAEPLSGEAAPELTEQEQADWFAAMKLAALKEIGFERLARLRDRQEAESA